MLFTNDAHGASFSKDPAVAYFKGKYYLFHTIHKEDGSFSIGIAESDNLDSFTVTGELASELPCEKNGMAAPSAFVRGDELHLFYQTYGNGRRDAICHALSFDGKTFRHDGVVYAPPETWCCGRAIDADTVVFGDKLFLYYATRDMEFKKQMLGCALTGADSDLLAYSDACADSILYPELPWEGLCIEAPAATVYEGKVYLFYGGAYNCSPQQIGCAVSEDGVNFKRISDLPLLKCGLPGSWNASESGHPYVFEAPDGKRWLFYQGSPDMGKSWYISKAEIIFTDGIPSLVCDKVTF